MQQNVAVDQGLLCLPLIQQFLNTSIGSEMNFVSNFLTNMERIHCVQALRVNTVMLTHKTSMFA